MVNVTYHTDTEHLFDDVEREFPGLKTSLANDFKRYIESDFEHVPARFGKFDLYTYL